MVIGKIGRVTRKESQVNPFSNATRIAVFAPILAVAAVSVRVRYYPDPVQPWHAPQAAHERVIAYGDVIAQTEDAIKPPAGQVPVEKLRGAANLWVQDAKKGVLRPFPPAFYVDTTMEGPKIEIERSVARLSSNLMYEADQSLAKGKADDAVQDAIDSYRLCEIIRVSDLTTAATGSSRQRRAMLLLASALPKASPTVREEAKKLLDAPRESILPVVQIAVSQRDEWTDRYHQPRTTEEIRAKIQKIAHRQPKDFEVGAGQLRDSLSKADPAAGADLLFNVGRAVSNEWWFEDARHRAIAAL